MAVKKIRSFSAFNCNFFKPQCSHKRPKHSFFVIKVRYITSIYSSV